jgi:hypothetical protein
VTRPSSTPTATRKRGRPKKRLSAKAYKDRRVSLDGQIFEFIKAQLTARGGKGKELAIGAAMERFGFKDRRSIQRKIAPFEQFEKIVSECTLDMRRFFEHYEGVPERLAAFYTEAELRQLGQISPDLAQKIADEREELEQFRRARTTKLPQQSAVNK